MMTRTTLTQQEQAFVNQLRVARLATANEQGEPTLVPVCYAFDGQYFYTPLDAKPKRVNGMQLRRVRNIETRHTATLLLDQYADDWSKLGYIQIYAHAEIITSEHPQHQPALLLLRARYEQYQSMPLENAPFILLTPERINTWGPVFQSENDS